MEIATALRTFFAREERRGGRRLFDDLLMTPLHAALALAERVKIPVRVGEDLHLDVTRLGRVALHVDTRVRERRLAAIGAALERAIELGHVAHDLHSDAAAATDRLHDERKTNALGLAVRPSELVGRLESESARSCRARAAHPRRPRRDAPSSCRRTRRARRVAVPRTSRRRPSPRERSANSRSKIRSPDARRQRPFFSAPRAPPRRSSTSLSRAPARRAPLRRRRLRAGSRDPPPSESRRSRGRASCTYASRGARFLRGLR